jgi:hypothetical protein
MLLNLIVVLAAFAALYVVRERLVIDPTPRLVASITIVAAVLGFLIIGAAPRDCPDVVTEVEAPTP